jgi:hypothetical protein
MPRRPERILLFRSGRHLPEALDALRADSPACEITVVAPSAAATFLDRVGIDTAHRIVYDRTPLFRPWPFMTSAAGVRSLIGRFDRVCVLWDDPESSGQADVDRTALLMLARGFTAITADGALIVHRPGPLLVRQVTRAGASIGLAIALGLCVFLPARLLRPFRS